MCLVGCADTKPAADGGEAGSAHSEAGEHANEHGAGTGGHSGTGGSHSNETAAGKGGETGGGTQSAAKLNGSFTLHFVPPVDAKDGAPARPAQSSFIGSAADGPAPVAMTWVKAQEADGCTLYTPKPVFCDPGCGVDAVCVTDDQCVPHPTAQTLGTIHLGGVGDAEISMTAIANKYQPPAGTMLPFPPCAEGKEVQLRAEGGAYQSFTLAATCISELTFKGPIKITRGQPMKLTWSAPGKADLARIQIHVDISHHGGARGKIDCDVKDTGSFDVQAALVDKLVDLGVSGFPTVVVARVSSGGVKTGDAAQVKLIVQESIEREIEIDGLVSCTQDSDCPAPKTCQADLSCK